MSNDTERARLASVLLNNPLLDESLAVLKEGYTQALMACATGDNEGRWRYAAALRGLVTIKAHIHAVFQRGQITQKEIGGLAEDPGVFERVKRTFAAG